MSSKITQDAIRAFMNGDLFSRGNTQVRIENETVILSLHGKDIAERITYSRPIRVSNAGWFSNTTKEHLNGIPGVSVCQRKGVWYLNGKEWDGSWTLV